MHQLKSQKRWKTNCRPVWFPSLSGATDRPPSVAPFCNIFLQMSERANLNDDFVMSMLSLNDDDTIFFSWAKLTSCTSFIHTAWIMSFASLIWPEQIHNCLLPHVIPLIFCIIGLLKMSHPVWIYHCQFKVSYSVIIVWLQDSSYCCHFINAHLIISTKVLWKCTKRYFAQIIFVCFRNL